MYIYGKGPLADAVRREIINAGWELTDSMFEACLVVSEKLLEADLSEKAVVDLYPFKDKSVPFYKEKSVPFVSVFPVFYREFAFSEFYVLEKSEDERITEFLDFLRDLGVTLKSVSWSEYKKILEKYSVILFLARALNDSFLMGYASHLLNWREEVEDFVDLAKKSISRLKDSGSSIEYSSSTGEFSKLQRSPSGLNEMRHKIRLIDLVTLNLIEERMEIARKIAEEKKKTDSPIDLRDVEEQKVKELLDRTSLNPVRVRRVFEEIMKLAKEEEYRLLGISKTVAVLGPMGSFSDEMALKLIGSRIPIKYCASTDEIIEMVEKGEADYGIVPIENSTHGTVISVLDALLSHEVEVFGEAKLEVHHCLVAKKKLDLKEIKKIYSHPQAISQSLEFLNTYLSHAEIRYTSSTSDAVNLLDDESAAIMSENAAKMYGLFILRKSIQDLREKNITRFYVIRRKTGKMEGKYTSLFFGVQDRPGSLKSVLDVFASRGMNLRKLESRPARTFLGDYVFFVEVEAPLNKEDLKDLERVTTFYKIIGVFDETEELNVFE
ncbi:prephenate dehydratase [Thermotoga sp.]|uniref:prephenate dehydratase n=1 Tax=Thermotoga sp. TaxID=28240 RepID=UPI0025F5120D|nr:prephenate dehydratase [Thermotoga sp.]